MSEPPSQSQEPWYLRYQLTIRSYDQIGAAIVLVLCVVGMLFYLGFRLQREKRFIDIDQIVPHPAVYRVDVNSAEWPELANLPGIGAKLARSIVAYRTRNGAYQSHEELIEVSGIGPAKLAKFRSFLAPIELRDNE